jgi:cell wall assembly regulator SMI1
MLTDIIDQWDWIVAWCRASAPRTAATIRGPVDEAKLSAAQDLIETEWPADLVELLRQADGCDRSKHAEIFGPFMPSSVERIVEYWQMMTRTADELAQPGREQWRTNLAGSNAWEFLREWIPIAGDASGLLLFVDQRPGPRHGGVGIWEREDAFTKGLMWSSVGDLLASVIAALKQQAPFAGGWVPRVRDDGLEWRPV